jgi:hypothetical protein
VLLFQGSSDPYVSPDNLGQLVLQWTNVAGISETPTSTNMVGQAMHSVYGNGEVESFLISGMQHAVSMGAQDSIHPCSTTASYYEDHGLCAAAHVAATFGLLGGGGGSGGSGGGGGTGGTGGSGGAGGAGGSGGAGGNPGNGGSGGASGGNGFGGSDGTNNNGGEVTGGSTFAGCSVGGRGNLGGVLLVLVVVLVLPRRRAARVLATPHETVTEAALPVLSARGIERQAAWVELANPVVTEAGGAMPVFARGTRLPGRAIADHAVPAGADAAATIGVAAAGVVVPVAPRRRLTDAAVATKATALL